VGIVVVSVLLLGGVGYGIYALAKGGSKSLPAGWKEYTFKNDGFRAAFPESPEVQDIGNRTGAPRGVTVTGYMAKTGGGSGGVGLMVMKLPSDMPRSEKDTLLEQFRRSMTPGSPNGTQLSKPRSVTWAGQKAEEITLEQISGSKRGAIVRYMFTETTGYIAVLGTDDGRLSSDLERTFFDSFQLLK
jgi:hypothetical protein